MRNKSFTRLDCGATPWSKQCDYGGNARTHGRLASSSAANDGNAAARLHGKAELVQYQRQLRPVAHANVVELNHACRWPILQRRIHPTQHGEASVHSAQVAPLLHAYLCRDDISASIRLRGQVAVLEDPLN